MTKELRLTDAQYLSVLRKIETTIAPDDFKVNCFDSTFMGDGWVESNCGFCNDEFMDKGTAMWPKEFPTRRSMKYRRENHKCPFDLRTESSFGFGMGCFASCYLFRNREHDVQLMRKMVADRIKAVAI